MLLSKETMEHRLEQFSRFRDSITQNVGPDLIRIDGFASATQVFLDEFLVSS